MESSRKGGVQENKRRIFLVNIVSKIYENVLKSRKETVGRKQRSTVDNLIILNSIIENQRENDNKTY